MRGLIILNSWVSGVSAMFMDSTWNVPADQLKNVTIFGLIWSHLQMHRLKFVVDDANKNSGSLCSSSNVYSNNTKYFYYEISCSEHNQRLEPDVEFWVLTQRTYKEKALNEWEINCFRHHWSLAKSSLNFCNIMMGNIDLEYSNFARNCPRRELKSLVGSLTGHACHYKFLKRIGVVDSDNCRFCHKDIPEDMSHLLHFCDALTKHREAIFGSKYLTLGDLKERDYRDLIKFSKPTEIQKLFNKWND